MTPPPDTRAHVWEPPAAMAEAERPAGESGCDGGVWGHGPVGGQGLGLGRHGERRRDAGRARKGASSRTLTGPAQTTVAYIILKKKGTDTRK